MSQTAQRRMTVEEFFEWQSRQDRNYELVDGVPVLTVKAMTGATVRHDMVTVNAIASLHRQLRGTPCGPRTADQAVRTFRGVRRPDVSVECGQPDDQSTAMQEPRVVIEILSPSTTRYDRFQKLEEYKDHATIKVILLIDTEAPRVTVWRRATDWTNMERTGLDAVVELPEINASLALSDLYEGLSLPGDNLSG